MRVRDVAQRLDVSVSLVYALIGRGKLRCTRHGLGRGAVRISEEQLADYLAKAEGKEAQRLPTATGKGEFKYLDAEKLRRAWRRE